MDTGMTKESTILSLSQEIGVLLSDLQSRLDNSFSRTPSSTCKEETKIANENVLDDILDRLIADRQHVSSIISFINSDVLPKIN